MSPLSRDELQRRTQQREDLIAKCRRLRDDGLTWKEVGEACGTSSESVRSLCRSSETKPWFQSYSPKRCVYEGLRRWLNDNQVSIAELSLLMYGEVTSQATSRLSHLLRGETRMTKADIDDLLEVIGLSYELVFGLGRSGKEASCGN